MGESHESIENISVTNLVMVQAMRSPIRIQLRCSVSGRYIATHAFTGRAKISELRDFVSTEFGFSIAASPVLALAYPPYTIFSSREQLASSLCDLDLSPSATLSVKWIPTVTDKAHCPVCSNGHQCNASTAPALTSSRCPLAGVAAEHLCKTQGRASNNEMERELQQLGSNSGTYTPAEVEALYSAGVTPCGLTWGCAQLLLNGSKENARDGVRASAEDALCTCCRNA